MGIIPRLIVMMRNRRLADLYTQDHIERLAKAQEQERKQKEREMLALLNDNSFENSMSFNLGSLLRD
jgi:sorbitol-specific phosphotransferase system component IIC